MAVKIKLKRMGKIRAPYYRIVVADSRTKRDGRAIEEIGIYHPKEDPSRIEVQGERAQYWLGVGAQPTGPVLVILKLTGDWQAFKGLPAPPPLLVKEPKVDRSIAYHAAVAVAKSDEDADDRGRATTARKPRKQAARADGTTTDTATPDSSTPDSSTSDSSTPDSSTPDSSTSEVLAAEGGIPADAAPPTEAAENAPTSDADAPEADSADTDSAASAAPASPEAPATEAAGTASTDTDSTDTTSADTDSAASASVGDAASGDPDAQA